MKTLQNHGAISHPKHTSNNLNLIPFYPVFGLQLQTQPPCCHFFLQHISTLYSDALKQVDEMKGMQINEKN